MKVHRMKILPGVLSVAALSLVLPSMTAANSIDEKKPSVFPSAADLSARKPGPAWKTIGGTIKHIKGDVYTVEDYEGNEVRLHISRETKRLRGSKKVGDRVRAEITHSGFANSIQ